MTSLIVSGMAVYAVIHLAYLLTWKAPARPTDAPREISIELRALLRVVFGQIVAWATWSDVVNPFIDGLAIALVAAICDGLMTLTHSTSDRLDR